MVITNDNINLKIVHKDTFTKKIFSLMGKKNIEKAYLFQNENKVHTFLFKENVDVIAINKKNTVIFKYQNTPRNKLIEISNDKDNTDIFILPNNYSDNIKIGDILTFVNEDII